MKQREKVLKHLKNKKYFIRNFKNIGLCSFCRNKKAALADMFLGTMIIMLIILIVVDTNIKWLIITNIVLLGVSLIIHSFYNGKNYRYIKYLEKLTKGKA